MQKWKPYLKLQLKKVVRAFPGILLLTLILTLGIVFLMQIIFTLDASEESKKLMHVGIVGDAEESYLGMGITVLKNTDAIESMMDISSMSEEEAKEKLAAGEISAYLLIPEGFVDSVLTGENLSLTYVTTAEAQGLGGILVNELIATVSDMITTSQNAICAMQLYLVENDMNDSMSNATIQLNLRIIEAILNRMDIYQIKLVGVANNLSLLGYYFCSMMVLFLLLWGINCVSQFAREDVALFKILYRRGYSVPGQVLSEFLAYCVLMIVSMGCMLVAGGIVMNFMGLEIAEWELLKTGERLLFGCKLLPIIVMISAFQVMVDELVPGIVNGVLAQFLVTISLAYLSGCFYPVSFFPEAVQKLANILPTGVGLRYIQNALSMGGNMTDLLAMVLYTLLFLAVQMSWRKHRIAGT